MLRQFVHTFHDQRGFENYEKRMVLLGKLARTHLLAFELGDTRLELMPQEKVDHIAVPWWDYDYGPVELSPVLKGYNDCN